jgi:hypothetical protein
MSFTLLLNNLAVDLKMLPSVNINLVVILYKNTKKAQQAKG